MPKSLVNVVLVALCSSVLGACATNPVTGDSDFVLVSEDEELAIGRQTHREVFKRYARYDDESLQEYVQLIGERLAANSHRDDLYYRFTVLDSDDVNAFALPGGYIYITRGMLAHLNSEAELAAVLGHEIGHVTARHSVRQISMARGATIGMTVASLFVPELGSALARNLFGIGGGALLRGYGRNHELDADRLGAEYLAQSAYDPEAMIEVVGVLKDQELFEKERAEEEDREPRVYHGIFATHPDNDTRLQEVVRSAKALKTEGERRIERDAFLRRLDGLAYGPNAREGVLRGNRFYHDTLDFGLTFPETWRVENRRDRLVAEAPGNAATLMVTAQDLNRRIEPKEFMRKRLNLKKMRDEAPLIAGDDIENLVGYTGIAGRRGPYGHRLTRFSVVFFEERAFVFLGAAKEEDELEKYDEAMLNTARSLHHLSDHERPQAKRRQIKIVRAGPVGTTYERLGKESALTSYPSQWLRLLNGDFPDGEPEPGRLIKTIR